MTPTTTLPTYCAFVGPNLLAQGELIPVLQAVREHQDVAAVLIFQETTGAQVDFDLRGSWEECLARLESAPSSSETPLARSPGRPKLGITCREICLLPSQWEWLAAQPGGPSVTLRKLVHEAARKHPSRSQLQTGVDRVLLALAGNYPGYEEASRALWADNLEGFLSHSAEWPGDLADWAQRRLAGEE